MSTAAAEDTVKLGYPLTAVGALAVVAEQTELWSKNGLISDLRLNGMKVESVPFAAAINVRDALVGGRIDSASRASATVTHGAFVNCVLKSAGIAVSDLEMVNLRFQDMISASPPDRSMPSGWSIPSFRRRSTPMQVGSRRISVPMAACR